MDWLRPWSSQSSNPRASEQQQESWASFAQEGPQSSGGELGSNAVHNAALEADEAQAALTGSRAPQSNQRQHPASSQLATGSLYPNVAGGSFGQAYRQSAGTSISAGPQRPSGNPFAPNSGWQSTQAAQQWQPRGTGDSPSLYPTVSPPSASGAPPSLSHQPPAAGSPFRPLDNSDPWDRATLAAASTGPRLYPSLIPERQLAPSWQQPPVSAVGPSQSLAHQPQPPVSNVPWELSPWRDSSPAQPLSDEEVARKLQEELNAEHSAEQSSARPRALPHQRPQVRATPALRNYPASSQEDDERLARRLQEEADREEAERQQAAYRQPTPPGRADWGASGPGSSPTADDEALANALQQEEIAARQRHQPPGAPHMPPQLRNGHAPPSSYPPYGPGQQTAAGYPPHPSLGQPQPPQPPHRLPTRGARLMDERPAQVNSAEDEALARALQEQFNREAAPTAAPRAGTAQQHSRPEPPARAPTLPSPRLQKESGRKWGLTSFLSGEQQRGCRGCGQPITPWGGQYMEALGSRWHRGCLRCGGCGLEISDSTFSQSPDGKPYHMRCFREAFHPRCCVCAELCPQQEDGRIRVMQSDFWRESFCPKHTSDGTVQCCACGRLQPGKERWVAVEPKRHLCLACVSSIVVDSQDAQPLYDDVLRFYERMGMRLPEKPPILLVDSASLGNAEAKEGRSHGSRDSPEQVFHTRGLMLSQEYQQMQTVVRNRGSSLFNLRPEVVHIPGKSHCEVTAILVLHGLPYLMTGSIIAHELMHAWLRLTGTAHGRLHLDVEEGLCQLMALLWLEGQPAPLKGTWEERLHSYCAHKIRSDPSVVYGDGFRAALESFQKHGLPNTLQHVRETGHFAP